MCLYHGICVTICKLPDFVRLRLDWFHYCSLRTHVHVNQHHSKKINSSRIVRVHAACTNCLIQMSAEMMNGLHMHVLHGWRYVFFPLLYTASILGHGNA